MSGLQAILEQNRERLLRFLRARGAEDAEDLLQDLWIKVESAPDGPIADPLSYLFRAANNLMLDRRRSLIRAAQRDRDWSDIAAGDSPPGSEQVLIARERLRRADEAIDALGERTAYVFRRFRIDNVGQRDIAQELGLSLSAVEKHLQKAYRALVEIKRKDDAV